MSANAVLSRIQSLEAKVASQNAANTAAFGVAIGVGNVNSDVRTLNYFTSILSVQTSLTGPSGWLTYTNNQIPSTATSVMVSVRATLDTGGSGSFHNVSFRANSGGATINLWDFDQAGFGYRINGLVPCNGSSFQYNVDQYVDNAQINVIGYVG